MLTLVIRDGKDSDLLPRRGRVAVERVEVTWSRAGGKGAKNSVAAIVHQMDGSVSKVLIWLLRLSMLFQVGTDIPFQGHNLELMVILGM